MNVRCSVCHRERPRADAEIVVLNDDEVEVLRKAGHEPLAEYPYCKPCWRMIGDRQMGARLVRGMAVLHFRQQGHSNPEVAADRVYEFFLAKGRRRPS